jgi:hypothetical protein
MSAYILILFALFDGGASAAVRVGFDSQITCVAAAKDLTDQLKRSHPNATIDWACVKQ